MVKLNNQKVWAVIVPLASLIAGYLGFEPIQKAKQEYYSTPSVDVEVVVPDQTEHTHATHSHVDYKPVIQAEIEKARRAHITEHH